MNPQTARFKCARYASSRQQPKFGTPCRLRSGPFQPVRPISEEYKASPHASAMEHISGGCGRIRTYSAEATGLQPANTLQRTRTPELSGGTLSLRLRASNPARPGWKYVHDILGALCRSRTDTLWDRSPTHYPLC